MIWNSLDSSIRKRSPCVFKEKARKFLLERYIQDSVVVIKPLRKYDLDIFYKPLVSCVLSVLASFSASFSLLTSFSVTVQFCSKNFAYTLKNKDFTTTRYMSLQTGEVSFTTEGTIQCLGKHVHTNIEFLHPRTNELYHV